MEPLGQLHFLGRKLGVQHLDGDGLGGQHLFTGQERDGDGVRACGDGSLGVELDPHRAELVLHDGDHAAVVEGLEPVGVEAGLLGDIVGVLDLGVDGVGHGHQLQGAGGDVLGGDTLDLQGQHGAVGGVVARQGMEELEGEPLVLHHADEGQGAVVLDEAIQKGLFQGGNDLGLEHMQIPFSGGAAGIW